MPPDPGEEQGRMNGDTVASKKPSGTGGRRTITIYLRGQKADHTRGDRTHRSEQSTGTRSSAKKIINGGKGGPLFTMVDGLTWKRSTGRKKTSSLVKKK